jgi:hypothetical protein
VCAGEGHQLMNCKIDKVFSSAAKTHFSSFISSFENDISNIKKLQNENYFK